MALVNQVGRKRFRARFALLMLYSILILGAVTTVYPFAIMMSGGFRGATDQNDNSLVPKYWNEFETTDEKTKQPAPESLLGKYLADKYAGDLSAVASTRIGKEATQEEIRAYEQFLSKLPLTHWAAGFRTSPNQVTSRLSTRYQGWLRSKFKSIDDLNKAYIEENTAFQTVQPPSELLDRKNWLTPKSRKYQEWLEFKASLPVEFRMPIRQEKMWQDFIRAKHENRFDQVPEAIRLTATNFEEISLATLSNPASARLRADFESKWQPERYLKESSESLWNRGALPIASFERAYLREHQGEIKSEFTWRNYRYILDYIAINGRALWNTVIFCVLAILTQLTINPLAAYALSRYPVKQSGKILLFLLATMAFPAEVAMIPSFLLLKDLGLLNTFAALVLPTAASGYMIFLLKGFFDSLPPELFESGQIDGAKETTMMLRIAFPLSKPVLGYLGLMAFMSAYGAFMYAFLVAQDQRIWTLMVFIYQLQNSAPKSVMLAALTMAAVPTLIVFLCAQRVIMRGIILPGEK